MLTSKSIFKASLNGSLVLRPVIHAAAFFGGYQTEANADYCIEVVT